MPKYVEVNATKEFASTFLNDIFFKSAVNRVLDAAPAADVDKLTSAERQAIFRLGQMDARESMAAMLRDAAKRSKGLVGADLMAAAEMVEGMYGEAVGE